jgi:4a-hydroxytetrahydrobiopterin dehydratase
MERRKITTAEIEEALKDLPGWSVDQGRLSKQFKFATFAEAIGWMVTVAIYADQLDHHPDWSNGYNKVNVELLTHDMDALSTLDLALARRMQELAGG